MSTYIDGYTVTPYGWGFVVERDEAPNNRYFAGRDETWQYQIVAAGRDVFPTKLDALEFVERMRRANG